jgi:hypothetical protein
MQTEKVSHSRNIVTGLGYVGWDWMHRQGSSSWRFGHGDMGYLHTALFVRDAVRLPVASSADVPPRLARDVPDYSGLLPPGERAAAGRQWVIWWRRLVGQAAREARQSWTPLPAAIDPDDFEAHIQHRFAGREDVFDPPDFRSLADMQPLRSAVAATFEFSLAQSGSQPGNGAEPERFAWPLVRDAAERAAADLGLPVGDVKGYADVLEVEGLWSYLAGPGCALCSAAVACDPPAAAALLREVFSSVAM